MSGIAPPHVRRTTAARVHKHKQETDSRHPLYDHEPEKRRLKSRRSFMTEEGIDPNHAETFRLFTWKEWDNYTNEAVQYPKEELPSGTKLPRNEWVTLNRARAKLGRTADTMNKWGLAESGECVCGFPAQTMVHIIKDCTAGTNYTDQDLDACSPVAMGWVQYWSDKL